MLLLMLDVWVSFTIFICQEVKMTKRAKKLCNKITNIKTT